MSGPPADGSLILHGRSAMNNLQRLSLLRGCSTDTSAGIRAGGIRNMQLHPKAALWLRDRYPAHGVWVSVLLSDRSVTAWGLSFP